MFSNLSCGVSAGQLMRVVGANGRDFAALAAKMHMHQPKPAADHSSVAKLHPYLLGRGAGGDVVILGVDIDQHIPHAATDQICLVTGILQALDDAYGIPTELPTAQRMLMLTEDFRCTAHRASAAQGGT